VLPKQGNESNGSARIDPHLLRKSKLHNYHPQEAMQDPVMLLESGHTYERASIETWLHQSMCVNDTPQL
jgi:hypothetical protein